MKKIIVFLMAALFAFTVAWAAGTVTETSTVVGKYANNMRQTTFEWVTHTDGSLTAYTSEISFNGIIYMAVVNPDTSTAGVYMTPSYDITVTNEQGVDIFGGALADLDSSLSEARIPLYTTGVYYTPIVNDNLTITLTNNSGVSAKGKLILFWEEK